MLLPIRLELPHLFFPVFISGTPENLHWNIISYELVSALYILPQSSYTQLTAVCICYA